MNSTRYSSPSTPGLYAILGLSIWLSACANFKESASTAPLPRVDAYATAQSLPEQGGTWPNQAWAFDIGGLPLQALVDEALAGNPGLQIAAARVSAAQAISEATAAAGKPAITASGNSSYQRFTENGSEAPSLAGNYRSDNRLALNFSYEFDFWGKHAAALRAAISQTKAAEAELHAARLLLSTAVARAWLQLARQYEQLDLVERQLRVREKIEQLTQQRIAAGLDSQTNRQQARSELASIRAEQAQWQEMIALTRNQLAALLGQGPDRGIAIARPALPMAGTKPSLPAQLPLGLLGRRPDIVAARWRTEAASGGIDNAKAQFYPNINLLAFAGLSSLGLDQLLSQGSLINGIGPAISLPVFDGGRLRAQLQDRVASYDAAAASYQQTLGEALRDVADQVQSLRAVEIQIRNQRTASDAAAISLELARQRQRVGTTNLLQVLSAEAVWLSQRKLELDTWGRSAELRVNLIKSLGGGFEAARHGLLMPS